MEFKKSLIHGKGPTHEFSITQFAHVLGPSLRKKVLREFVKFVDASCGVDNIIVKILVQLLRIFCVGQNQLVA